uniref:Uncharacterized protein n=1 Tax=Trypanosoma congolense (strain IL3000) TaxID=1068625 RepID=G0V072_TRYCI|nr:hypothetical protein, unlikely [Trypanosoma congolense IL3000]
MDLKGKRLITPKMCRLYPYLLSRLSYVCHPIIIFAGCDINYRKPLYLFIPAKLPPVFHCLFPTYLLVYETIFKSTGRMTQRITLRKKSTQTYKKKYNSKLLWKRW